MSSFRKNAFFNHRHNVSKGRYVSNGEKEKLKKEYAGFYRQSKSNPNDEVKEFIEAYENLDDFFERSNEKFVEEELIRYESFFNDIRGMSLDESQRKAIVVQEDEMQIIAGAGSGKTLTIEGKVKYLLDKGVKPSEILCLSYSNKSVDDLKKKLSNEIEVSTFHSLGNGILREYGEGGSFNENTFNHTFNNFLKEVRPNKDLLKKIINFFSYYEYDPLDAKLQSLEEIRHIKNGTYFKTLKAKFNNSSWKTTLKNETVKSYEELVIANFLFLHGIDYQYEKPYEGFDDRNISIKMKDYKPDFFLGNGIYLEHFGVDRNHDAPWLSKEDSEKYKKHMYNKIERHKKYNTTLLTTYSYQMSEGTLLEDLESLLKENGFKIKDINYVKIFNNFKDIAWFNSFGQFKELLFTFINLFKGNGFSRDKFNEFKKEASVISNSFKRERHLLFLEIAELIYGKYELNSDIYGNLDFNDMIVESTKLIEKNGLHKDYKYIIVDEFQDISDMRLKLLKAIKNACNSKLFVVGDDWQSIYGFNGSNISLFTDFDKNFKNAKKMHIESTYRNSQPLINFSKDFISQNPKQIPKSLTSKVENGISEPFEFFYYVSGDESSKPKALEEAIQKISEHSKDILILQRYNYSIYSYVKDTGERRSKTKITSKEDFYKQSMYKESPFTLYGKLGEEQTIKYDNDPSLNISVLTVHSSKGLEAENVIILDLENSNNGFPSNKEDDSLLSYVKFKYDDYEFADERRLFYVAITRSRNYTYLLVNKNKESLFSFEMKSILSGFIPDYKNKFTLNSKPPLYDFEKEDLTVKFDDPGIETKLKCPICKQGNVKIVRNENFDKICCSNEECNFDGGFYKGTYDDLKKLEYCRKCKGILYFNEDGEKVCSNHDISGCDGKRNI